MNTDGPDSGISLGLLGVFVIAVVLVIAVLSGIKDKQVPQPSPSVSATR